MPLTAYLNAIGAIVAIAAIIGILRLRRALRQAERKLLLLSTDLSSVQREQSAVGGALRSAATERKRLAQKLVELEQRQAEANGMSRTLADNPSAAIPERVLEGAIRRIRLGADPDSLIEDFGLSAAEAELLTKLHAQPH